jgi:hypothetical protein
MDFVINFTSQSSHSSHPSTIYQESALSDIFSWSTSVETKVQAFVSSIQPIPIDIRASQDFDAISDLAPSTITTIFDPTTLDIEFDHSCLEGLDIQLLHCPIDAFAAVCWLEATKTIPTHLAPGNMTRNRNATGEALSPGSSSDESESDSDECRTRDDNHMSAPFAAQDSDTIFAVRSVKPMVSLTSCL